MSSDSGGSRATDPFPSKQAMESEGRVTRCVCVGVTFAELKRRHDQLGATYEQLRQATGCAKGCSMCEPYIRRMIETGQTEFEL